MQEELISESIKPVIGTMDTAGMSRGEPGLPQKFLWRGEEHTVAEVLEKWKDTGRCSHGSPERYVRKHWFRIRTTTGEEMTIYFERQASSRNRTARWWLYTITPGQSAS